MMYDKGLVSKDMIEYSGCISDEEEHTEEDLFEMFEMISIIHYNNKLIETKYEIAKA